MAATTQTSREYYGGVSWRDIEWSRGAGRSTWCGAAVPETITDIEVMPDILNDKARVRWKKSDGSTESMDMDPMLSLHENIRAIHVAMKLTC